MIDAIQAMTHFIRTAFGDSSANYSADPLLAPYMGLLQGNAAAMAGCTAFVSVIVEMMKSAGFGLEMWNVLAHEAIKLVCLNLLMTPNSSMEDQPTTPQALMSSPKCNPC